MKPSIYLLARSSGFIARIFPGIQKNATTVLSLFSLFSFSFSFVNQMPLNGNPNDGYTATASFTSSAVPEPATMCLLALGGLAVLIRRRNGPQRHRERREK